MSEDVAAVPAPAAPKTRRAKGEGGLTLRKDGLWMATLSRTEGGKRIRTVFYGQSKEEARKKLKEAQKNQEAGVLNPSKDTVEEFCLRWLDHVKPTVRHTTYVFYRDMLLRYVTPVMGSVPLAKLTPLHIEDLLKEMEKKGKSSRLRHQVHVVFGRALDRALKWHLIPHNPVHGVDRPKWIKGKFRTWNAEQVKTFLEQAKKHRLYGLFMLGLRTGMRQGELLGLTWSDVDLKAGTLTVNAQLMETDGAHVGMGPPKSAAGARVIGLDSVTIAALKARLQQSLAEGTVAKEVVFENGTVAKGLVFLTSTGTPYLKTNLHRTFKRFLNEAKLPDIRFHDLRHTNATLLLEAGVELKAVSGRLGHSQLAITADTYVKYTPKMDQKATDAMAAVLA